MQILHAWALAERRTSRLRPGGAARWLMQRRSCMHQAINGRTVNIYHVIIRSVQATRVRSEKKTRRRVACGVFARVQLIVERDSCR